MRTPTYTQLQLIEKLQVFVHTYGRLPNVLDCRTAMLPPVSTFNRYFGSFGKALRRLPEFPQFRPSSNRPVVEVISPPVRRRYGTGLKCAHCGTITWAQNFTAPVGTYCGVCKRTSPESCIGLHMKPPQEGNNSDQHDPE